MKITKDEKKIITIERVKKLEQTFNELVKELKTEEHCIYFVSILYLFWSDPKENEIDPKYANRL